MLTGSREVRLSGQMLDRASLHSHGVPMRIGLIGTGRIGSFHAGVLARHPGVEHLVVADTDAARAAEVAALTGATAAATVADAFSGVDAVVIASATSAHAGLITAAAH